MKCENCGYNPDEPKRKPLPCGKCGEMNFNISKAGDTCNGCQCQDSDTPQ